MRAHGLTPVLWPSLQGGCMYVSCIMEGFLGKNAARAARELGEGIVWVEYDVRYFPYPLYSCHSLSIAHLIAAACPPHASSQ